MNMENSNPVDDIFVIKVSEIQYLAKQKFGKCLDEKEIKEVQNRSQRALQCCEKVVLYAIEDVIHETKR